MANITGQAIPTFYFNFNKANGGVKNVANGSKTTITIKEDQELILMLSLNANFTLNFKAYILLYEGTEDKPYEQYGASPSIDYPSEIKTVGSNVNLIPTDETDWEQGTIDIGTPEYSTTRIRTADYCPIKYYEQTISLVNSDSYVFRNIHYYDSNKKYINNQFALDGNKLETFTKLTFTPPAAAMYFKAVIAKKDNSALTPNKIRDIKPKLEKGTIATLWSPHNQGSVEIDVVNNDNTKSQTAIIPIQQEMLTGDYIKDVEHHEWGKVVLTGDEAFGLDSTYQGIVQFSLYKNTIWAYDNNIRAISNYFQGVGFIGSWTKDNTITTIGNGKIRIMTSKYTTIEDFKAMLKSKYEAGTPVIIYYKLAEPVELELTDEQKKAQNQKLYTYKNITNIILSDELASIDVTYKKDLETMFNNIIKQIPSSTSDTTET